MNTDEIILLFEYNYWTNYRLLATCAQVSLEVDIFNFRLS